MKQVPSLIFFALTRILPFPPHRQLNWPTQPAKPGSSLDCESVTFAKNLRIFRHTRTMDLFAPFVVASCRLVTPAHIVQQQGQPKVARKPNGLKPFSHWYRGRQIFDVDSRILTSMSKFNLTPNWWVSKNSADHSLTSSRKVAVDVRKS